MIEKKKATGSEVQMSRIDNLKHRVFIVDDHPVMRQGVSQLISQEKDLMMCGDAGDITHALRDISASCPDIVMIDISLGQSNGIRLIEELALYYQDLLILAFSMHDEFIYAERCLRAGARGYIMKQESPEKVIFALRKVLSGEIYIDDSLGAKLLYKLVTNQSGKYISPIEKLSNRELEVFQLIGQGMKTRNIAERMNISVKTVESYMNHIKRKMNFNDSRDLFKHAVQWLMHSEMK